MSGQLLRRDGESLQIFAGEKDVALGDKGAGKSAIYSLSVSRRNELFDRNILVVPRKSPAAPRLSMTLWSILRQTSRSSSASGSFTSCAYSRRPRASLALRAMRPKDASDRWKKRGSSKLGPCRFRRSSEERGLRGRTLEPESVSAGIDLDPVTGLLVGLGGKITFREPSQDERRGGLLSMDSLLGLANEAYGASGLDVWLILDRCHVTCAESERNRAREACEPCSRVYSHVLSRASTPRSRSSCEPTSGGGSPLTGLREGKSLREAGHH